MCEISHVIFHTENGSIQTITTNIWNNIRVLSSKQQFLVVENNEGNSMRGEYILTTDNSSFLIVDKFGSKKIQYQGNEYYNVDFKCPDDGVWVGAGTAKNHHCLFLSSKF